MPKSNQKIKDKLIKLLEENPNLLRACKLAGVARATAYRWLKLDPEFADRVELAQEVGRDSMVDFAEAKLFENMKNNHQRALEYFLSHNSPRYATNAVQERHSAHRNVGRLAKLPEGTDGIYLYPQTQLFESAFYYQNMNDGARKLKDALSNPDQPLDLNSIDPMLAKLFFTVFPEAQGRIKQIEIDKLNEAINMLVEERRRQGDSTG